MAKLTDRYENKNLVDLAKKQYEKDQRNTIPSEIITLTSQGKVYPKDHLLSAGKIEMRYMTAYDEDILTNASYQKEGVVLDKLIEALIITDVDLEEIAQVDKDGLILNARILSYGAEYPVTVKDPKTGAFLERSVDLSKLTTRTIDLIPDDNGEFNYSIEKNKIKFGFPSSRDYRSDITTSEFLQYVLREVNGSRKKQDIDHFIRYEFLAKDSKKFQKYLLENSPIILLEYEFETEGDAGGTFTAGFPLGLDLFWF